MSTRVMKLDDDRVAALWADERQSGVWGTDRQAALDEWLAGRPDRQALLRQHEALIADPATVWAAQRVARTTMRKSSSSLGKLGGWAPIGAFATAAVAAAVVLMVVVMPERDRIVGHRGASDPVTLADGSAVRLNGTSEVNVLLGTKERRLRLKGEGFFEVAPDKQRPFTVEADGVLVTAVGTRFNVNTYDAPEGRVVEVVVFEGVVEVSPGKGEVTRISAGERAEVLKGRVSRAVQSLQEAETDIPSWAKGWLELDEASLLSVVGDLQRATGVQVTLADPDLGGALVSGRFAYDHPENALAAIARLHGLKLTRKGPERYVLSEG